MTYDWLQLSCALNGVAVPRRHVIITVNGTGSPGPFDWGFAGEVGSGADDEIWYWQPAAYPAATFPMGPSVVAGVNEVVRLANLYLANDRWTGKLALAGYSQGSLVTDFVWRDEILKPTGRLHSRVNDIIAITNFGDPMRCPGICNGNLRAGFPLPNTADGVTTGGIANTGDLKPEETPDFLMSCNNDGDLYGAAPVGDSPWTKETGIGHDEMLMFNLVQNLNTNNITALLTEALAIFGMTTKGISLATLINLATGTIEGIIEGVANIPLEGVVTPNHVAALVGAVLNGGLFVVSGMGPHGDYEKMVPAMIDFVNEAGRAAA